VHFLARRLRQQRQTSHCINAVLTGQSLDHGFDAPGIENGLAVSQPRSVGGKSEVDDSSVAIVARAGDVPSSDEPINGKRHCGCADAHMTGERVQAGGISVVQMIKHPRLMDTDRFAGLGITNVS
jgi:hypothetical protein